MSEGEQYRRRMTPVRVMDEADGAEVVFLESAQFYRLPKENPAFDSLISILREAVQKGGAVEVRTASIASIIIDDIRPAR